MSQALKELAFKQNPELLDDEKVSQCCFEPDGMVSEDGPDWSDLGLCPRCKDNTEFEVINE